MRLQQKMNPQNDTRNFSQRFALCDYASIARRVRAVAIVNRTHVLHGFVQS